MTYSRQAGVIETWPERRNDLVEQLRSEALEVERHGENEIWKWQDYRLGNTEKHSLFLLRRPSKGSIALRISKILKKEILFLFSLLHTRSERLCHCDCVKCISPLFKVW